MISTMHKDKMAPELIRAGLFTAYEKQLSPEEKALAVRSEYYALEYMPVHQLVYWNSQKSSASGIVDPGHFYSVGLQNCRQYSHTLILNGIKFIEKGSACRNNDGSWTTLE